MDKLNPMHGLLAIIVIFFGFYIGSLAWSLGSLTVDQMEQHKSEQLCINEMIKEGYAREQVITSEGICYLKAPDESQPSISGGKTSL